MSRDMLSQIREYGSQMDDAQVPLTVSEVIDRASVVQTIPQDPRGIYPRPPRRGLKALAFAAGLIVVVALTIVLAATRTDVPPAATTIPTPVTTIPPSALGNGWAAFAAPPPEGRGGDHDIYLVGEGQSAFRVAGSDSDGLDQECPAFSPDGARLAYGEAEGTFQTGYANGTLVVADVSPDGTVSESFRVDTGSGSAHPCPTWSPDGENIAVAVRASGAGGDIWIVPADTDSPTVLEGSYVSPDPPAFNFDSDFEFSPDGTELAVTDEEGISLYTVADQERRSLEGTAGARTLTWSPDGTRIAYEFDFDGSPDEIRIIEVDGTGHRTLASNYEALHGIGPVWSPNGDQILYQRVCCGGEQHEVVLVTLEGQEVVLPQLQVPGIDGIWWPRNVTWSPDGSQLLVMAWNYTNETGQQALIAVPVDPGSDPVMLHRGDW